MDVAEELFAEQGLDRVSIRDITVAAGVNLAAVNYHFGGKEDLIGAIFLRRVGPVNEARLAALTDLEEKAQGKALKVEEILGTFIQPAVAGCLDDGKGAKAFGKLFGRCIAETRPEVEALLKQQFQPVVERLEGALLRALPELRREDIFWRLKFTFGALHHWLLTKDKAVPEWAAGAGMEEQTRKLIAFAAAGFKAKSF